MKRRSFIGWALGAVLFPWKKLKPAKGKIEVRVNGEVLETTGNKLTEIDMTHWAEGGGGYLVTQEQRNKIVNQLFITTATDMQPFLD